MKNLILSGFTAFILASVTLAFAEEIPSAESLLYITKQSSLQEIVLQTAAKNFDSETCLSACGMMNCDYDSNGGIEAGCALSCLERCYKASLK